jgi:mannose-6-phosphate isomerase-like protein (cupin superfamily)
MLRKINLAQAFGTFDETWSPRRAGTINDCEVKLAKLEGEFIWHQHENEDELFFVIEGRLEMRLRDQDPITLEAGEMLVVPRGVEHLPVGQPLAHVLMFESAEIVNTGNAGGERTVGVQDLGLP